jgi:hypothetical protein
MLTHPTLDKLQALKLMGMYHALMEQMQMPEITEVPFEERLGLLVDRESTAREDRRLKTCSEGGCQGVFTPFQAHCARLCRSGALRRLSAWRYIDSSYGVRFCQHR